MVGDIGMFLEYPWGRESFLLTVSSGKIRSAGQLAQDTLAIQGFAHAMVLVTVCSCPQIIADPRLGEDLVSDDLPIEDIVDGVCARSVKINILTVQTLELTGQAPVRSILCEGSDIPPLTAEKDDLRVNHMVSLIRDRFPFEINTWRGGVKASDAKQSKGVGGLGASSSETVGQPAGNAEADRPENANTEGLPGVFDVSTLARLVATELHARALPIVTSLKEGICGEIQSLKDVLLGSSVRTQVRGDDVRPVSTHPTVPSAVPETMTSPGESGRLSPGSLSPAFPVESPEDASPERMSSPTERDTACIEDIIAELAAVSEATENEGNAEAAIGSDKSSNVESHHVVSDPSLEIAVAQLPIRGLNLLRFQTKSMELTIFLSLQTDSEAPDKEGHSEGGTVDMESDVIVSDPALQVASDAPETSGIGGDNASQGVSSEQQLNSDVTDQPTTGEVGSENIIDGERQRRSSKRARCPNSKYTPPPLPVKKQKGKKGGSRAKQVSNKVPTMKEEASSAATTKPKQSGKETKMPTIPEEPSPAATSLANPSGSLVPETKKPDIPEVPSTVATSPAKHRDLLWQKQMLALLLVDLHHVCALMHSV
ncbi:Uncharacterized protein Rs2_48798 [Raphanus sativus]|nr:Uncharacterized protein Rs2_48798 [Raphanus sativus]